MFSHGRLTGLLFLGLIFGLGSATASIPPVSGSPADLDTRARQVWGVPVRDSRLADATQTAAPSRCELTRPPEALTTPDPLIEGAQEGDKVTVSFIIGTDGTVQSPLILESAGQSEDQHVLEAIRSWRYRPATCNGVPTEAEAKIEFSNR